MLKRSWRRTPAVIRKPLVMIVGGLVVLAGVILFFIPGPGWLTVFLGLAILATEFPAADRLKQFIVRRFKSAWQAARGGKAPEDQPSATNNKKIL